jgi:hypothetical protein
VAPSEESDGGAASSTAMTLAEHEADEGDRDEGDAAAKSATQLMKRLAFDRARERAQRADEVRRVPQIAFMMAASAHTEKHHLKNNGGAPLLCLRSWMDAAAAMTGALRMNHACGVARRGSARCWSTRISARSGASAPTARRAE